MLRLIVLLSICALTLDVASAQSNIKSFDLLNMSSGSEFKGFNVRAQQPSQIAAFEAQTPNVIISGAENPIKIGELVILNATLENKPTNLYSIAYSWTVLPRRELLVWPDGTKAIFGTGTEETNYTVILTTSFVYAVKDQDKIVDIVQRSSTQTLVVNIGDNGQKPPVNPTEPDKPTDPPTDVPTDPQLSELSKKVVDWASLIVRSETNQDEDIKIDAANLSKAFLTVASQIDSGQLTDINSVLSTSKTLNDSSIKHRLEWLPWFAKVSEFAQNGYKDGSLKELQQYSKAWKEIAAGLEYIGN